MVNEHAVNVVSDIIGWLYFLAWSGSFYPQSIQNYFNKSVGGFSLEFALLNPSGFFFYSVYSVAGRVNSDLGTGTVSDDRRIKSMNAWPYLIKCCFLTLTDCKPRLSVCSARLCSCFSPASIDLHLRSREPRQSEQVLDNLPDLQLHRLARRVGHRSVWGAAAQQRGHFSDDGLLQGRYHLRQVSASGLPQLEATKLPGLLIRKRRPRLHGRVSLVLAIRAQVNRPWRSVLRGRCI